MHTQRNLNGSYQILETGPLTQETADHIQPARHFGNLILHSETFTLHVGKPTLSFAGRSVIVSTGRCLSGGSTVNFAIYARAAASDYDDLESVHKNPGWGSKHLIPLLKKHVRRRHSRLAENPATHGTFGPIKASFADEEINVGSQFLAVASQYDKERGYIPLGYSG
ncbi:hypothetical protein D9615_010136 [Tricholomella constricta]|uniref:Glucose-methanol-choline oxidoreductase N-terminal domain-containing protein n=1 Tax=Tricholomella constricta TaxID=117010 RepID=A0A8H5GXD3_9AGAR|nr:hypothetical protein D9615_010136 [Tricholomella constricta]